MEIKKRKDIITILDEIIEQVKKSKFKRKKQIEGNLEICAENIYNLLYLDNKSKEYNKLL